MRIRSVTNSGLERILEAAEDGGRGNASHGCDEQSRRRRGCRLEQNKLPWPSVRQKWREVFRIWFQLDRL